MRVFLKAKRTGLYYRGAGKLSVSRDEALEFPSVPAAARCAINEQLTNVEIALRCDYLDREIPLPVMSAWCEEAPGPSEVART